MKAYVRDVEHLEEVIDRFAVYGQTTRRSCRPRRCRSACRWMPSGLAPVRAPAGRARPVGRLSAAERTPARTARAVGEELVEPQARRAQLALDRLARELGADLGADLLAVGERRPRGRRRRCAPCWAPFARRRISIHELASSKKATCSNASGSKSASSPSLITRSTLRLNSAVTPCAVVVGGLEHAAVLDQVGADQRAGRSGPSARAAARGTRARSSGRGCRSCRRGRRTAAARRRACARGRGRSRRPRRARARPG